MEHQLHGAMPGTAASQISITSTSKQFKTLVARFALAGHVLVESNSAHGVVIYHVTRWGMEKVLPDLDAVQAFLIQIGGAA